MTKVDEADEAVSAFYDKEDRQEREDRQIPMSDLELQQMTLDPEWGKATVSMELQNRLRGPQEEGKTGGMKGSLWFTLAAKTRDNRLGFLDHFFGDMTYCQHYTDLQADLLQEGEQFASSAVHCINYSSTVIELSQSKNGFLRKRITTRTRETQFQELEPPKKSFFGGRKPDR